MYEVLCFSGKLLNNKGRGYVSRKAARSAADRAGEVPVETRELGWTPPHCNDAAAWDDMGLRDGYSGCHH